MLPYQSKLVLVHILYLFNSSLMVPFYSSLLIPVQHLRFRHFSLGHQFRAVKLLKRCVCLRQGSAASLLAVCFPLELFQVA